MQSIKVQPSIRVKIERLGVSDQTGGDEATAILLQHQLRTLDRVVQDGIAFIDMSVFKDRRGKFEDKPSMAALEKLAHELVHTLDCAVALLIITRPECDTYKDGIERALRAATMGRKTIYSTRVR
jgi:hypothetical protein